MLPGKHRGLDFHCFFIDDIQVFDHDHGIGAGRQCMPGVDPEPGFSGNQHSGGIFAGTKGVFRVHGHPIHGGRVKIGTGQFCHGRGRQNPVPGGYHIYGLHTGDPVFERVRQDLPGAFNGLGVQIYVSFGCHDCVPFRCNITEESPE